MRTRLLSILVVVMVVLSGCSAVTDTTESTEQTPTATSDGSESPLSTTVAFPNGGVVGEESVVEVEVPETVREEATRGNETDSGDGLLTLSDGS
jgi:hypothetical protein